MFKNIMFSGARVGAGSKQDGSETLLQDYCYTQKLTQIPGDAGWAGVGVKIHKDGGGLSSHEAATWLHHIRCRGWRS